MPTKPMRARPRPKKFAVTVSGQSRPISEHSCISDCLERVRDALKRGAASVSVVKLKGP